MKRVGLRIIFAAAAMSTALSHAKDQSISDNRILVWTVQVAHHVKEPAGWTEYEHRKIDDLAFSPDDQRLAVTITHNGPSFDKNMHSGVHVLVVGLHSPETNVQQFDLSDTCGRGLDWSPTGTALVVCGTILRLADGASCDATGSPPMFRETSQLRAFWLDSEHVIHSHTGEILDIACRQVGKWDLEPSWLIGGVVPSKGWVLMQRNEIHPLDVLCKYSIVDAGSHRELKGWPTRTSPCGENVALAAGADAFCFNADGGRLHCRTIDGGKEIPVPKHARKYVVSQAATSSARVIAEKWEYDCVPWWSRVLFWWDPFPCLPARPTRRAILDLRSGNWISSWRPRIQDARSTDTMERPFHQALSTSGEFLAESREGSLELYRLPR